MLKSYNPTSPGIRHKISLNYRALGVEKSSSLPKSLRSGLSKKQGRSAQTGRITVRRRGAGHKRLFRSVDFMGKDGQVKGEVTNIYYDPNRTAHLAFVKYADGDKRLVSATKNMRKGFIIDQDPEVAQEGSMRMLKDLPVGIEVCSIELKPGYGAKLARSAGAKCFLAGFDGDYAILKMPSGETRKVLKDCKAVVGVIGNENIKNTRLGKAGSTRHRGIRPHVLGKSMNPVDHPHGGGKAHQPIGLKQRQTPWGKPTQGVKTRNPRKSNRMIISSRHSKNKKK